MQTDFCGYGGTADAPDLESGEKSCRFKSYYPHQKPFRNLYSERAFQYKTGSVTVDALKDVSFSLDDGEFVVVLGSSGAGKTTLLNLLGGMDKATSGRIVLDGKDVTALDIN